MDIVTLGAALNGSAEYVNSHFKGGSNIQIVDNPDGTQTINASGEVSSEDAVARAEIAAIKDGETLDSFGDVETALDDKADEDNVYKLALSDADLLPANTDLDNLKTVGCYYVLSSAITPTITHRPTDNTSAFRVTVELAAGSMRPRQIYQEFNSYDKYIRYETSSGTWAAWKKVECDLSTIYTKTAVDTALGNKADKSTTYTKTEVDTALGSKQDTISDLSTIRSGAALGATAVQPETGKGLSTNDYTTVEKTKLAGIAQGAEVNEIVGIKVNNTTVNPDVNKVVNITVPTSAADVSALPDTTKYAAALSLTINSSTYVMTGQLKDQNGDNLGRAQTIDLPLESVVVGGSYNSQTKKVVLTLQNGNTIEFSVADLVSGLQTELSASNKLNPAYINYDSTHRAVSDTEKSTWNSKQNAIDSSHKLSADLVDDTNATNKFATEEELEQIQTNKNNILLLEKMNGAKNLAPYSGESHSSTGFFFIHSNCIDIAAGEQVYLVYDYTQTAGQISIQLTDGNGNIISGTASYSTAGTTEGHKATKITIPTGYTAKGYNANQGSAGNVSISNFMIVSADIYEAGFTDYQPYCMTNAEITAWILSQS